MYFMDNEPVVTDSTTEPVVEPVVEDVKDPTPPAPQKPEEKTVPYSRFKEVVDENHKLKTQPKDTAKSLDVNDYIEISASLEGLDQRQKEFLAEQHKLTGLPIKEIRSGENFLLWNEGYQTKVEKERALKPSNTQPDSEKPKTLADKLAGASLADKEKLLEEAGLWKSPRPRTDRQIIG
jgi:hypothetical protein